MNSRVLGYRGCRRLMLAVPARAVVEAQVGEPEAEDWLSGPEARNYAELLELTHWPPEIRTQVRKANA